MIDNVPLPGMPDPPEPSEALDALVVEAARIWHVIYQRALTLRDVVLIEEFQNSGESLAEDDPFLSGFDAGVATGMAAATEHYAEHPEDLPDRLHKRFGF